jgi:MFS family permease
MPRLRALLSDNQLLVIASLVYAAALAVLGSVRNPFIVAVALVPAGAAWMTVLSNLGAEVQMYLPGWVRARGLGLYQIVFFGGQAVGSFAWGLVAEQVGLVATFLAAALISAAGAATVRLWPLRPARHLNREPAYWPDPSLAVEPDPSEGPVVVEVQYVVSPDNEAAFLEEMRKVRRSRMRTGAVQWGIFREGENPHRLVEIYVVPTWDEHLRQHTGRLTGADLEMETRAQALTEGSPEVTHLLPARPVD